MDREEAIRARAHQIWENEGYPEGREADHWRQAAAEIDGQDSGPPETGGDASSEAMQDGSALAETGNAEIPGSGKGQKPKSSARKAR